MKTVNPRFHSRAKLGDLMPRDLRSKLDLNIRKSDEENPRTIVPKEETHVSNKDEDELLKMYEVSDEEEPVPEQETSDEFDMEEEATKSVTSFVVTAAPLHDKAHKVDVATVKVNIPMHVQKKPKLGVNDVIASMKFVRVKTRLLVSVLLTNPTYVGLQNRVMYSLEDVEIDEGMGGRFDFTSPLRLGKDDSSEGFLRSPLLKLLKDIGEWNANKVTHVEDASSEKYDNAGKVAEKIAEGYSRIIFKQAKSDRVISYAREDGAAPTQEDEDKDQYEISEDDSDYVPYTVNDFLTPSLWKCKSYTDSGIERSSMSLNLAHHNLALYDTGDKFKAIARMARNLENAVNKQNSKNVSVALAVVIDNSMLKFDDVRVLIEDMLENAQKEDGLKFDMYTSSDLIGMAENKSTLASEDAGELWSETEEIFPCDIEDVRKVLPESAMLFITSIHADETA